jgi:hypothetical protein
MHSPCEAPLLEATPNVRDVDAATVAGGRLLLHETELRAPLQAGTPDDELEQIIRNAVLTQGAQASRRRRGLRAAAEDDVPDRLGRAVSSACLG